MKKVYKVSNMTCSGCVAAVEYGLQQHELVSSAEVFLERGEVEIRVEPQVAVEELQQLLPEKYKLSALGLSNQGESYIAQNIQKTWLQTYKPLLLIAAFLLGSSLIGSLRSGAFNHLIFMHSFMAGFFLVFSFFKFLDLKGFANSYAMYDLLAARLPVYGYIYPFIELVLGIAYLAYFVPTATYVATILIMGFSTIGVVQSVLDKKTIKCACLGTVFDLPMTTVTIVEDTLMVAMAAAMLLF